jgi:FKBP-type peptidyl-prolyl cis-trans isomerase FklB
MNKKIKITVAVLLAVLGFSQVTSALAVDQSKLSYALGYQAGASFKQNGMTLDSKSFAKGIDNGLSGKPTTLNQAQMKQVMATFQKETIAKMQKKIADLAQSNLVSSQKFLQANKSKKGVVTTDTGLQYEILTKGTGAKPTASDTVVVDYQGSLINGKVFDSSYARKKPLTLPVKAVIKGWQQALTMMPVGSTWELFIPSNLAYGKAGAPGAIGPNEALVFKVHLRKIVK